MPDTKMLEAATEANSVEQAACKQRSPLGWLLAPFTLVLRRFRAEAERRRCLRDFEVFIAGMAGNGVLDEAAKQRLLAKRNELGLASDSLGPLPERVQDIVVQEPKRTNRMSAEQEETLRWVTEALGASQARLATLCQELETARILFDIDQGRLPTVPSPGILLQGGEQAHWAEPGAILEERVVGRRYEGGSSGMSFRIARGVSYRIGTHRGHVVTDKQVVPVSSGFLVLTNKRLVFNGNAKTLTTPWKNVLSLNFFTDGIQVSLTNRQKPTIIQFASSQHVEVVAAIASLLSARA